MGPHGCDRGRWAGGEGGTLLLIPPAMECALTGAGARLRDVVGPGRAEMSPADIEHGRPRWVAPVTWTGVQGRAGGVTNRNGAGDVF